MQKEPESKIANLNANIVASPTLTLTLTMTQVLIRRSCHEIFQNPIKIENTLVPRCGNLQRKRWYLKPCSHVTTPKFFVQQDSPPAGNRKRRTARDITCPSAIRSWVEGGGCTPSSLDGRGAYPKPIPIGYPRSGRMGLPPREVRGYPPLFPSGRQTEACYYLPSHFVLFTAHVRWL